MAEYIEREAAVEAAKHAWAKGLEPTQYIEMIPAVEVVPVVRCRDCKSYNKPGLGWCSFHMDRENQDDFCSYGERKAEQIRRDRK